MKTNKVQQDTTKLIKFILTSDHTYETWLCASYHALSVYNVDKTVDQGLTLLLRLSVAKIKSNENVYY